MTDYFEPGTLLDFTATGELAIVVGFLDDGRPIMRYRNDPDHPWGIPTPFPLTELERQRRNIWTSADMAGPGRFWYADDDHVTIHDPSIMEPGTACIIDLRQLRTFDAIRL